MSIIKDHEVFEAYFTNEERDTITVELVSPDDHETPESTLNVFLYTFPAEKKNPDYKALLKKVSEDELHERTIAKVRNERDQFENMVVDIAKRSNEFTTVTATHGSADFVKSVMDFLDKELNEQDLFTFKLNLFEHESVQESKNRTKKANLRKATTVKEAFKIFLDF